MSDAVRIHRFDQAHAACNTQLERLIYATQEALIRFRRDNAVRGVVAHLYEHETHVACAELLACALERLAEQDGPNTRNGMTTTTPESRARMIYTAYGKKLDFRTHDNRPMPTFDELTPRQQQAWSAGAELLWSLATTGRATLS